MDSTEDFTAAATVGWRFWVASDLSLGPYVRGSLSRHASDVDGPVEFDHHGASLGVDLLYH